jgi:serine/threonine protein kinase
MRHVAAASALANLQPEKLAQPEYRDSTLPSTPMGQIGPWMLKSLVYEGTFAQVYQAVATSKEGGGRYALKLLRESWQHDPKALARLRQEWIVSRAISHHRVASILSAHLHKPPYYVVTPWIDAASVASHLSRQGPIETSVALWIARQTAEGLEAMHNSGYVHGDVNPANLLFASGGHVTLTDFDCARRWGEESVFDEQTITGTPVYLAPEIFAGHPGDPRSDIYGLGVTLFEILAGRPPVSASDLSTIAEHKLRGALPNVRIFAPHVPAEVAHLVRQLTARDPLRRPQRARDAIQALVRLEIATLFERVPV